MSYSADVLTFTPIGYWRQGDASGTTMTDSSGNGRNGTYTNSPTLGTTGLLTGDADTAATFASASSQHALVTDDNSMDGLSTLTIIAWIKPTTISGVPQIVSRDTSGTRCFQFRLNATGTKLEFVKIAGGTVTAASSSTISTGVTTMVAMVYNGTDIRLYINGSLNGTPAAATGTMGTSLTELQIACRRNSSGNAPTDFFNGVLDEVSVHGSALSAANILALYNSGRSWFTGTFAATLPVVTASLTGTFRDVGTFAATLPSPLTASFTGTYTAPPTGTFAAVLPVVTADFTGTHTGPTNPTGSFAATLPVVSASFSGTYTPGLETGSFAAVLPSPLTASFTGTFTPFGDVGTFAAVLPVLTARFTGTNLGPYPTDTSDPFDGLDLICDATVTVTRPVAAPPATVALAPKYDLAVAYPDPVMDNGRPT